MTNYVRLVAWSISFAVFVISLGVANAATLPPIVVKLVTVDVLLSADGTATEKLHYEVQANNEASALRVGQTSISYESTLESIQVLNAHTLKPDGSIVPVNGNAIYDQVPPGIAQAPMISNMRNKVIVFPQFSSGDVAVYDVVKVTKTPLIPGEFWLGDLFVRTVAYDDVKETITAPKTLPLFVESQGVTFFKTDNGTNVVYSWHYSAPTPMAQEIRLVTSLDNEPHFFASTFRDYAELGRAYATMTVPKMATTPKLVSLANQITHGEKDRYKRVEVIYDWVSKHIRYVAIELGTGSFVPHDPDDIIANGYGDCKDHVVLLGALLKAAGIESEGLLVNSASEYTLPKVPTFATLDHEITWVPEFNLYLDSSVGVAPFGVLPLQEYGKPVVRASLSNPGFDRLPVALAGATTIVTKTDTQLDASGQLVGTTTTTATGPYSVLLRAIGLGIQNAGPESAAAQQLARLGYGGGTGSFIVGQPTDLSPSYSISSSFVAPGWGNSIKKSETFFIPGGLRLFGYTGDGPMGPLNPGQLKDSEPVACISAHEYEDLSFHLPPNRNLSRVPSDSDIATPYIRFTARWTLRDGTLSVHRDFTSTINQAICSADIRKQNAAALKSITDNYNTELSLAESVDGEHE